MNAMSYPTAVELSQKLRARRKAKEKPTMSKSLNPSQKAYLEAMLREGATADELNEWRKEIGMHHISFAAHVRAAARRVAAETGPAPMPAPAPNTLNLQVTPDPAPGPAGAIVIQPAAPAPGVDQLINWLATLRAMRDDLAAHGVEVEGSLSIRISL